MTEFLTKRRMKVVEEAKDTLILKMSGHRRVLYIVFLKEKNMLFITFQIFMKVQLFFKKGVFIYLLSVLK